MVTSCSDYVLSIGILFDFTSKSNPDKFITLAKVEGNYSEKQSLREVSKHLRVRLNSSTVKHKMFGSFGISDCLDPCYKYTSWRVFVFVKTSECSDDIHPVLRLIDDREAGHYETYLISNSSSIEDVVGVKSTYVTFTFVGGDTFIIQVVDDWVITSYYLDSLRMLIHPKGVIRLIPNPAPLHHYIRATSVEDRFKSKEFVRNLVSRLDRKVKER